MISLLLLMLLSPLVVNCVPSVVNFNFAGASCCNPDSSFALGTGKWDAKNYQFVKNFIKAHALQTNAYVVFDWDNTAGFGDVQETFFQYQIQNLVFKLNPSEFRTAVSLNIPSGPLCATCTNSLGQVVTMENISTDLGNDYEYLYNNYMGFNGTMNLTTIKTTPEYQDFSVKLQWLYDSIDATYGSLYSYPWVLYWCAKFRVAELKAAVRNSIDYWIGSAIRRPSATSPDIPTAAGRVTATWREFLRVTDEIANLIYAFRTSGIDVWVVTASLERVVEAFAGAYGYNVPEEYVIGMRLQESSDTTLQLAYEQNYPITYRPGKVEAINRFIAPQYGGVGPIFVAGDSDTDYEMLTNYTTTALKLIVNRVRGGPTGSLSQQAVSEYNLLTPSVILQGRDENTGIWRPSQGTVLFGSRTETVLRP